MPRGSVLNRIKFWQKNADMHKDGQTANPFSNNNDKSTETMSRPKKGDEEYGRARRGSFTEQRAQQAQEWVNKEIEKLVEVLTELGTKEDDGTVTVKFGPLFVAYQDISDTLVGILQRAKKRGRIDYPGEILFQGAHDEVTIVLKSTQQVNVEESRKQKLSRHSCVWAEQQMPLTVTGRLPLDEEEEEEDDDLIEGLRKSSLTDLGERLSYVGDSLRLSDAACELDEDGNPLRKSAAAA